MSNISFAMGIFSIQNQSNSTMGTLIFQWEHHIPAITCGEGIECYSTRMELFYFDDNFRHIAQWVLAFRKENNNGTILMFKSI